MLHLPPTASRAQRQIRQSRAPPSEHSVNLYSTAPAAPVDANVRLAPRAHSFPITALSLRCGCGLSSVSDHCVGGGERQSQRQRAPVTPSESASHSIREHQSQRQRASATVPKSASHSVRKRQSQRRRASVTLTAPVTPPVNAPVTAPGGLPHPRLCVPSPPSGEPVTDQISDLCGPNEVTSATCPQCSADTHRLSFSLFGHRPRPRRESPGARSHRLAGSEIGPKVFIWWVNPLGNAVICRG